MEGRSTRSRASPENYTRAIASLSRRYSNISAFPGNNYVGIGEWMLQDRRHFVHAKERDQQAPFLSTSEDPHDLIVVYTSGGRKWDVRSYSQGEHEAFSSDTSFSANGSGQIVFMRGFLSPSWVSAVGSKYSVDPEFFRRHMDYLSTAVGGHAYSFPSLASSSFNIMRLCVNTILARDDFGGQNLQSQRSDQSAEMGTYRIQQLGSTRMCCGDSLVREYSTLCSCFSVAEQWISLCLVKTESGWTVIAWLDHGRPLDKSPAGPWTNHVTSKATALPILQHHPKMAFRTTTNRLEPPTPASSDIYQTTSIIPLQYDSIVALVDLARRAPQDPFSMCIPLFAHAAFSEAQLLNLLESRIQRQVDSITLGAPSDGLETLQYFSNILNRHAQQLRDAHNALASLAERSNNLAGGDRVETQASNSGKGSPHKLGASSVRSNAYSSCGAPFTPKSLFEDYEQLHSRCTHLEALCTRGMTLAMSKATIDESRKAIEQSARLKKLTLLATLFIPLNFSSSLFGMNIDLLGQNAVKFWWFFIVCIPITLAAYCFYTWDLQALVKYWGVTRKRYQRMKQAATNSKADQGHGYSV